MFSVTDEDDEDFSAKPSKLANLFDTNQFDDINTYNEILTYRPPKQPKKISVPVTATTTGTTTATNSATGDASIDYKMNVIHASAVDVFKFENGKYVAQGKLGAALLGNDHSFTYKLVLYTAKQQHITYASINNNFKLICQTNNYNNFYDDNRQNWSIMFDNEEEKSTFSRHLTVCKYNCIENTTNVSSLITQDLLIANPNDTTVAEDNDSIEVRYKGWLFHDNTSVGKLFVNIDISSKKSLFVKLIGKWSLLLLGMKVGDKRFAIIPVKMKNEFLDIMANESTQHLIRYGFEFEVIAIRKMQISNKETEQENTDHHLLSSSTVSTTQTDTTNDKTKRDILSRVTRMGGLPILPFKNESIVSKAETSEPICEIAIDSMDVYSNDEHMQTKPFPKPRNSSLTLNTGSNQSNQLEALNALNCNNFGQIPASYQMSPYFSGNSQNSSFEVMNEMRTNNLDIKMNLSKINDKIELICDKVNDIKNSTNANLSNIGFMDSAILLSSIQRIVNENNCLKKDLEERNCSLQKLNEKICDLLNQQNQNQHQMSPTNTLNHEFNELRLKTNELNAENSRLKNTINELKLQIENNVKLKVTEESNLKQTKEFTNQIKKLMNQLFRKFNEQIDENKTYKSHEIIEIVSNSIRISTKSIIDSITGNTGSQSVSHSYFDQSFDEIDVNKSEDNAVNKEVENHSKPSIPQRKTIGIHPTNTYKQIEINESNLKP